MLVLSAWCGLAGGLLEVGTRVVCKILPSHRMYLMSRHFIWMAPLSNLLLFTGIGLFLALATKFWPRRGGWLFSRLVCFLAILPVLIVMGPRIYPWAWAILAVGLASRLVPILERRPAEVRRWLMRSFPGLLAIVLVLGGLHAGRRLAQGAARAKPSLAFRRFPERAVDRTGHGASRSSESLRLPAADQPHTRGAGQAGYPLRRGARDSPVDPPLPCEHVYRPLAP